MKEYKYIKANNIEQYKGWEIYQVIPAKSEDYENMVIIFKEDIPIKATVELEEATIEQIMEELSKRLGVKYE